MVSTVCKPTSGIRYDLMILRIFGIILRHSCFAHSIFNVCTRIRTWFMKRRSFKQAFSTQIASSHSYCRTSTTAARSGTLYIGIMLSDHLQRLQNRVARIITRRKNEHGQYVLAINELKWITLKKRRTHFRASLMYKLNNKFQTKGLRYKRRNLVDRLSDSILY